MTFRYVGVLFVVVFVLINTQSSAAADDAETRLFREYDRRICENKPSCDLTNSVQKDRLTLKKRNCMCDFECSEYDDCCMDSQYFNGVSSERKYDCHPYSQVYVVTSCAANYQNQSVIAKCEKAMHPLQEEDFDIVIPVTNTGKRITYANRYCAICNNDRQYESWDFYASCGEPVDGVPLPTVRGSTSRTSNTPSTTTQKSKTKYAGKPQSGGGRKYETNTKANVISDDFIGGCRSENSPCRGDHNPEITPPHSVPHVPNYEYQKPVQKYDAPSDSPSGVLNIRIEIGGRFKRQQNTIGKKIKNYTKYHSAIDDLIRKAKYDESSKNFVVTADDGTSLVCLFNSTYPKTMEDAIRICVPNVVSQCASSGSPCPSYTSIAYDSTTKIRYRNRECARCNGVTDDKRLKGCFESTRAAASKDLAKTGKKSQDADLEKLSENDAVSFN